MTKIEELKNQVQELIKSTKDENIIKSCGGLLASIDSVQQEQDDLSKKHAELVTDYGKAIIQLGSKKPPEDETKHETPKTLEQIIQEELAKSK